MSWNTIDFACLGANNNMYRLQSPLFYVILSLLLTPFASHAIAINLNDFFADPTVTVAADGSSAFFAEEPGFSTVSLSNDPGLGDPNVIIPGAGIGLFFDYSFVEAAGEDDSVFQFVLDGVTGGSLGAMFEFSSTASSSGTVFFDLTSLVGTQLGLSFSLQSGVADTGSNSTLTISNVRLDPIAAVPAPIALVNLLLGLGGLSVFRKRKRAWFNR
jgi:hypothetical protein